MNVGAEKETDYGQYFQWGDTQGYTADQVGSGEGQKAFTWSDYKFNPSGDGSTMSKYNVSDGKTILDTEDDAATVNWGDDWHMPTRAQIQELLNTMYVTNTWVPDYQGSGVNGRLFTSRGDSSKTLFIPAAGECGFGSVFNDSTVGNVWASSTSSGVSQAWFFYITSNGVNVSQNDRRRGLSIRPVIG